MKQLSDRSRANISTMAELLSALAFIVGACAYTYSVWESRQVQVDATFLISRYNGVSFFVSNTGGVDLAIKSISITSEIIDKTYPVRLAGSELSIPKGTSKIIASALSELNGVVEYAPDPNRPELDDVATTKTRCVAHFAFVTASGMTIRKDVASKCYAASIWRD